MQESITRKMARKIGQSLVEEQDRLSPVEKNWISNDGKNIITNLSQQLIFKIN